VDIELVIIQQQAQYRMSLDNKIHIIIIIIIYEYNIYINKTHQVYTKKCDQFIIDNQLILI